MIQISNLHKSFGSQVLFDGVSFSLGAGERLGLVGRNGHGKTTLLKLITSEEDADQGEIHIPRDYRIGHLSQHLRFTQATVLEEASTELTLQEGGWIESHRAEAVLSGLGFSQDDLNVPPAQLSGGFQVRLNLAKLLVSEPNLLLLDEPTNYLDIVAVRWLVRFLRDWQGELVLITHDRGFMDAVCTHTLAIHRSGVKKVKGSTEKVYQQIALEEEIHEKTRANQEIKRAKTEQFITRFRAQATKASAVQSKIKALNKMEQLGELQDIETLSFRFNSCAFPGRFLLHVGELGFFYDQLKPLISGLSFTVSKQDRIGVIGKNGKGKTTLLNLLAGELGPKSGELEYSVNAQLSYFGQTNVERLRPEKTVEEEILEEHPGKSRTLVRTICGAMMFPGDMALKKISVLSGGEKSRVLLGKLLVKPANLLLLDEPTNHLDMHSAEALRGAISEYPGAVVLVTHDEDLLRDTANRLIVFDRDKAELFEGGYNDFLRRVGWDSEEAPQEELKVDDSEIKNKKELRRLRAQELKRRQELLSPLDERISQIEVDIMEREERLEVEQAELLEITKEGFDDTCAKLAASVSRNKERIDKLFEELEQVSKEREKVLEELDEPASN